MLDIALNFEQVSARFNPAVLVGSGLVCVVFGLFIWLGGLGYRRILAAVAGAVSGGVCGFFMTGRNVVLTAFVALTAGAVAVVFERIFITLLAAGLAVAFGFAILAGPYITEQVADAKQPAEYQTSNDTEPLSLSRTGEVIKDRAADFTDGVKQIWSQMPVRNWAIIAALGVIFLAAGSFLWSLTSALCCSALGTLLIFCGMILLLLYKGSVPISSISQRQPFYMGVFLAMIAVGSCVQLLLCRCVGEKPKPKRQKNKGEKENEFQDWRGR